MAIIEVEGLGKVEIAGETPTEQESIGIKKALDALSADVEEGLATDTAIPEIIDPNLADVGKPKGLELIGGRPTFEAAGAIAGSVVGTAGLNPATTVAGGVGGAAAGGQLHDILEAFITDEPSDFKTQAEALKKDVSREALLQTFFAKVPGLFTSIKRGVFGKPDKQLYDSAKKIGYPLSLSDSGNMISRGYGRVIGVFPYVGNPIKGSFVKKANILNKTANDTLNTFAPNVTLTKLGVDMAEASKSTYGDFRRVTSFFYDDFYKSVNKVGNTPVISTKNIKESYKIYTNLIDEGKITLKTGKTFKDSRKDSIYKFARDGKNIPDYITVNQYRGLKDSIKDFARKSSKDGYNIKVLTGFKSALEKDLRLLTKKSYQKNLLDNVYPMSKSKAKNLDPNLLSDIATKLKFADKVYANGLENSIITNKLKKQASDAGVKLTAIPGKKVFDSSVARDFKKVDKNIFGPGFEVQGSITADQLGKVLIANRNVTPQLLDDLRTLVGDKAYKNFVRSRLQTGYDKSLVTFSEPSRTGLMFDPYKFESNLGLNTEAGRELLESMLKGSKLKINDLDAFFNVAKNHAGLKIPDVSSFVARRATLGGTKSVLGGFALGYTSYQNPIRGAGLIYLARKTSNFLTNPKQLEDVMKVLDPNSTASQMKIASLKLVDAMISDSQNNIEKNELSSYREYIELLPTDKIRKELEEGIPAFTNDYLNESSKEEAPTTNNTVGDQSALPQQNLPQTPNVNVASLQPNNTTMNQDYNNLSSLEKDKLLRGIS
tara:strand:- start:60 stop:2378 length:2319 start_codon:yes stop_codon:yes gene_type:complete